MHDQLSELLNDIQSADSTSAWQSEYDHERRRWLTELSDSEMFEFTSALMTLHPPQSGEASETVLGDALSRVWRPLPGSQNRNLQRELHDDTIDQIVSLYKHLGNGCSGRHHLLRWLAECGRQPALTSLAEVFATEPPHESTAAAVVLSPLFRHPPRTASALFPRLLDAVGHLSVAASVLDLANFLFREGAVDAHPAQPRVAPLTTLLGELVQRLTRFEEQPPSSQAQARKLQVQIAESVALAVALCDTLALIGDRAAQGKLRQAMELSHRRIRTEAAAALAKLGEPAGVQSLLELAAEPVARLRVLSYAEELELSDKINPQYTTPAARAEAELALWLAQPAQFGIPPTRLQLVDKRVLAWPGFEEPVDCFLFRFYYELGAATIENIGIAGPTTCALAADLTQLETGDLYALFAGWQAQHEHIFQFDVDALDDHQRADVHRLERRLRDQGYDGIESAILGVFFGTKVLAGRAVHSGTPGLFACDDVATCWISAAESLGPAEIHQIYKGRSLLRAFNEA